MPLKTFLTGGERTKALERAAGLLTDAHDVLILTHKSPDGDTIGSALALCRTLTKLGKAARVVCADPIPEKFRYLLDGLIFGESEPGLIVSTDVASAELMGGSLAPYAGKVDLCIDHHPSNTGYAAFTVVDPSAAATCEIMAEIINILNVEMDSDIANCLYTGIATDTGCFRYSNTTPKTLRTAADMIEKGADSVTINKRLFETVSRGRLEFERLALETLELYFNGRAALITLTRAMNEKAGITDSETEGIPSIPARIEGVEAGITVKEKEDGVYKISLRTAETLNASDICANFGGGGHAAAAGCRVEGSLDDVKSRILKAVKDEMEKHGVKGEGE
jgi:bifunctional oligoribonuclease and PAP phosphatase NrnA